MSQQVDERSTQIGQQIGSVADDLRNVGQQLGESGITGPVAAYVTRGADLVDQLGQYLQDADSERLIGDLETIARRRPWAIAAGAAVLGFAASRFLKTSSARRYRGADTAYGNAGYGSSTYGGTAYGGTAYGASGYRGSMAYDGGAPQGNEGSATRSGGEGYAT